MQRKGLGRPSEEPLGKASNYIPITQRALPTPTSRELSFVTGSCLQPSSPLPEDERETGGQRMKEREVNSFWNERRKRILNFT
jgi:hypothetical protein